MRAKTAESFGSTGSNHLLKRTRVVRATGPFPVPSTTRCEFQSYRRCSVVPRLPLPRRAAGARAPDLGDLSRDDSSNLPMNETPAWPAPIPPRYFRRRSTSKRSVPDDSSDGCATGQAQGHIVTRAAQQTAAEVCCLVSCTFACFTSPDTWTQQQAMNRCMLRAMSPLGATGCSSI